MSNVTEMIYPDGTRIKQDYDLAGRLTQFSNKPSQTIHSRRIQKEVNGTTTNFFWEGDNLAYELDAAHTKK